MNLVISSVDHAPDDLDGQLPVRGRLVRMLEGTDSRGRSYWLAELATPLSWKTERATRTIRHLLVAARWVDTSIQPGAKIPVNINYVTDDAQLSSERLRLEHTEYVAIGMAKISEPAMMRRITAQVKRAQRFFALLRPPRRMGS